MLYNMKYVKRAKISILRQPVKSLILLLLTFILGTIVSGAISVTAAIRNTDENLRRNLPPIVSFVHDWEERMSYNVYETMDIGQVLVDWAEFEPITTDILHQIADLSYVNRYYQWTVQRLYSSDMQLYIPTGANDLTNSQACGQLQNGQNDCYSASQLFDLVGTSDDKPMEMQMGLVELIAGQTFENYEMYQAENVFPVMISTSFAEINHLNIGSTFSMIDSEQREMAWWWDWVEIDIEQLTNQYYQFKVIGLFEVAEQQYIRPGYELQAANIQRVFLNRIYIPMSGMEQIKDVVLETRELVWGSDLVGEENSDVIIILNDPLELESFKEAVEELLPRFWYVDDLTNSFDNFSSSMEMMHEISNWILWATIGATIIILVLLLTLFLYDRRHEVGIYLALGEKRQKIILQIISETVVIAFIGITFAIFTGNILSNELSHDMLRTEIAEIERERQLATSPLDQWGPTAHFSGGGVALDHFNFVQPLSPEAALDMFDTSLSAGTILLLYVVGLGTTIVATGMPVLYVAKMNPKKILLQSKIQ